MNHKLTFSGHDSFHCRSQWLYKGLEFISEGKNFFSPNAVVDLGVGKNMVTSVNYWLKSFGLVNGKNSLSKISNFIFGANGVDPYLEDEASLWLLHYHLIVENNASIYSLVFNEFRKQHIEFNKLQLLNFLIYKCKEIDQVVSTNTLKRDIVVFINTYIKPVKANRNLEELYSGLFIELDLIECIKKYDEEENAWYKIENKERENLPAEIILYVIANNYPDASSISFDELLIGHNSPGNIFALNPKGLQDKIEELTARKYITFTDDAGIREVQIKKIFNPLKELQKYYEK